MVVEQVTRRLDDIDGTELAADAKPLRFAFDGVNYEIDLTPDNVDAFRELITPYLSAARRSTAAAPVRRTTATSRSAQLRERRAIRDWAQQNGYQVSDRGRISDEILAAYEAR